jgi:hypothetical protein
MIRSLLAGGCLLASPPAFLSAASHLGWASLLGRFRITAWELQAVLWASLGLAYGWLSERASTFLRSIEAAHHRIRDRGTARCLPPTASV